MTTRLRKTFVLLIALSAALTAARLAHADLGVAFIEAVRYDWGDSRPALREIELAVVEATGNPAAAAAIERSLVALLDDPAATPAARDFACRQLRIIGSRTCVPSLARLLRDASSAEIARYALESIPGPEVDAALADAAANLSEGETAGLRHTIDGRTTRIVLLGERGGPEHVPLLIDLTVAGDDEARGSLALMTAPGVDVALAHAAEDADEAHAVVAIELLGVRGATARHTNLERLARPDHPAAVRAAALVAIARLYDWRQTPERGPLLRQALTVAESPASTRMVLAAIDRLSDPALLPDVQATMRTGPATHDAAGVVITLALALEPEDRDGAKAAIGVVLDRFADDDALRERAGEAIAHVERNEGYVRTWQIAGPFLESEASSDLIDFAFIPEQYGATLDWRDLPASVLREPGVVDLNGFLGGKNRCAYARAVLTADGEQDARLEIGSDDGVKVWLNGLVVHRNDAMRGLTLREDIVPIRLRAGKNELLVKITQGGGDWQFGVRVRSKDGLAVEDVSY